MKKDITKTVVNCPVCFSPMKKETFAGRTDGCINPECSNYYKVRHLNKYRL